MKLLISYIQEKLNKGSISNFDKEKNIKDKEIQLFKNYYFGLSNDDADLILNKYVYGWPLGEDIKHKSLCTAFELLFTLAAMLVDDGNDYLQVYKLGFTSYKKIGKNNPYDYSWFEEEVDDKDMLTICQEWIADNEKEFRNIYNLCKKYDNDLTIEKIKSFYEEVFDAEN